MPEKPKLSVGMPVYNGAKHLPETLDSILSQSFEDFELIISDNASTDDSEAVCMKYVQRDSRIRYYKNSKNIGASENYNTVFRLANGQYFKWASSNDIVKQHFFSKCMEILESDNDVVLCFPRTRLFNPLNGKAEDYPEDLSLLDVCPVERFKKLLINIDLNNIMNGIIRADILKKTPLIKTFYASDISLMADLALYGKFVEVPEFLFYRRMDETSATKLKSKREVLRHYDPELKNPMVFQTFKFNWELVKAVSRSPVSLAEKGMLLFFMLRKLYWEKTMIKNDFFTGIRYWLRNL